MTRRTSGQVLVYELKQGRTYALRFRAYGRREHVTLGTAQDGWTREKAEDELQNVLADVRRGVWRRPQPAAAAPVDDDPTFHEFASMWFSGRRSELRPATLADYRWQLSLHLLPFFHAHRLSEITIAEVDRYRNWKVREGILNATSINATIKRLAQILDLAIEYHPGLLNGNPARGRRRRLKPIAPQRSFLEADQLRALLDAAGELDREARADRQQIARRAMLATLALAGLRIGELVGLRWQDVDLAGGHLAVVQAKTEAGIREVEIGGFLCEELAIHRARTRYSKPQDFVFATIRGGRASTENIRNRILRDSIERANQRLVESGGVPIPDGITPHSLRRTYISLMLEAGENPRVVMAQVGHTDPTLTLRIYAQVMKRRERSARERLDSIFPSPRATSANEARKKASLGRSGQKSTSERLPDPAEMMPPKAESPANTGQPPARPTGFEPVTSRSGGERSIH